MKRLWEKYRDEAASSLALVIPLTSVRDSQTPSQDQDESEMDAFDRITLQLRSGVIRPSSGDVFVDYNNEESYDPGVGGALD